MTAQLGFSEVISAVEQIDRDYRARPLLTAMAPNDDMVHPDWDVENKHYFSVGENALEIVLQSMVLCRVTGFKTILDMPSGFGRVARHLKTAFPDATLCACDLYEDRISVCAEYFGAIAIKSKENFDELKFPTKFDLVWCGSLLTHLPKREFEGALALFSRSLNPNGMAIITLHGRHSPYIQHNKWKYLPDERFAIAEADYRNNGFGWADYGMPEMYYKQSNYGISLSAPSHSLKCLEADEGIRIKAYVERHWDDHQDVMVFQKTPLNS